MYLSWGNGGTQSLYAFAREGDVYCATALVTAMAAYTTATAVGGPLLWNGGTQAFQKKALILGIGVAVTTADAASGGIGIMGGYGQTAPPSATTAIDLVGCTYPQANRNPNMTTYRIGTVTNAASFFLPLMQTGTAALSTNISYPTWIPIDGGIVVPEGSWVAIGATSTQTTSVMTISLVWAERTL